ncbi:MAG: histidine phosphatase family protein [Acidobacteria bacterium]|nr:histidine phosphatase family protein [Acidobacteriota bacterium]
MKYIILVRHGETEWNTQGRYQGQSETELSPRGREQASALASRLADLPIDHFYSSPLHRTMATAEAVARTRRAEVTPVDELREVSHGLWEGLTVEEVKQRFGAAYHLWHREPDLVTFPQGESLADVQARAVPAIIRLATLPQIDVALICAHDAVNKVILAHSLRLPLSEFWRIRQDSTCVNLLEVRDGDLRPMVINDSSHLGPLIRAAEHRAL